ncbi:hypothetical protein H6G89_24905 [Oscillatoria sp. FACHB-1407]|uniref:hypothetical protein n=1 Tax=Oscillatoria sp. FACHB-1407 TaxID=2692847 RepID=UPI001689DB71|nr:hypothetical protein [Oscillatoria sp. FACHB-1407]MBD2464248.1 hypothetical protein [Oscillatoria sp. FACHB-1407]
MASITDPKSAKKQIFYYLSILLLICAICYWVFWRTGLLTSGFHLFINDHVIITMHSDIQAIGLFPTIQKWVTYDYNSGRFVPFYFTQEVLLTQLFGLNATLWFIHTCLLTGLTAFLLFLFASLIDIPILGAILFSGLTLIGPQADMWARPSYTQVPGTFLLAGALVLTVYSAKFSARPTRRKALIDAGLFVLVLLASMTKESYIIFIPALVMIHVWLTCKFNEISLKKAIFQNRWIIGILLGLTAIEIVYILLFVGTDSMGYAGVDEDTFNPAKVIATVRTLLVRSNFEFFVAASVLTLIAILWKKESFAAFFREITPVILITLAIVSPQIFLYTKSGIDGYYLIPATIGTSLLIVYALSLLQSHLKFLGYLVTGIALAIVLAKLPAVWANYTTVARDSAYMNGLLREASTCASNNRPILVVVNPRVRYEASVVTKTTLNYMFQHQNLILASYGLEGTDFFSDTLEPIERYWSFLDPQSVIQAYENKTIKTTSTPKEDISAVIVFDGLDEDFLNTSKDWFVPTSFEVTAFPTTFAPAQLYCRK